NCQSLVFISLPAGLQSLGNYAFYGCRRLREVRVASNRPAATGNYAFSGNAENRVILIPAARIEAYRQAAGWRDYSESLREH
ncbi:MAG: leucine-rich repeat domain-containing protein, partial [Spirochaetales bacterium]|nr:leucine-rich repeat domain-containing protein [Spirochaetales bacterium]